MKDPKATEAVRIEVASAIRTAVEVTLRQLAIGDLAEDTAETVILQIMSPPTVLGMEAISEVVHDVTLGKMSVDDALDWLL